MSASDGKIMKPPVGSVAKRDPRARALGDLLSDVPTLRHAGRGSRIILNEHCANSRCQRERDIRVGVEWWHPQKLRASRTG
jgi:hypothetical protein